MVFLCGLSTSTLADDTTIFLCSRLLFGPFYAEEFLRLMLSKAGAFGVSYLII